MSAEITTGAIIGHASRTLKENGYRVVNAEEHSVSLGESALLAEDEYVIVAVKVLDTVGELIARWADVQSEFVAYLDDCLSQADPKVWECYLLLLSPGTPTESQISRIERIRLNTNRVRKLVVAGSALQTIQDVTEAMSPILPLKNLASLTEQGSGLKNLPTLLARYGADSGSVRVIVEAFEKEKSLFKELNEYLTENES